MTITYDSVRLKGFSEQGAIRCMPCSCYDQHSANCYLFMAWLLQWRAYCVWSPNSETEEWVRIQIKKVFLFYLFCEPAQKKQYKNSITSNLFQNIAREITVSPSKAYFINTEPQIYEGSCEFKCLIYVTVSPRFSSTLADRWWQSFKGPERIDFGVHVFAKW
mgnify:CR=1 FL=1